MKKDKRPDYTSEAPLAVADVQRLPYVPATKPIPDRLRDAIRHPRVLFTPRGNVDSPASLARLLSRVDGVPGSFALSTADLGIPLQSGTLMALPSSLGRAAQSTPPLRLPWWPAAVLPLAALSSAPERFTEKGLGKVEPLIVHGEENRIGFYPGAYPYQCIGQLFVYRLIGGKWEASKAGTGTLVGDRVVLTARHVMPAGGPDVRVEFVPACYNGVSLVGEGFRSWVTDWIGWDSTEHAFDFAGLRLEQPLGSMLGYFGSKTYDTDWEDQPRWFCVGYHTDRFGGDRPSFQSGVAVDENHDSGPATVLLTSADADHGGSGGPMFGLWPEQEPYMIAALGALTIAREDVFSPAKEFTAFVGGRALPVLIEALRAEWPA